MTTLENSREMVKLNFFYSQGEKWRGSLRAKLFSNLWKITWLKKGQFTMRSRLMKDPDLSFRTFL